MTSLSTQLWRGYLGVAVLFMVTPLALVMVFSFGKNELTNFPMGGLSLHWYNALFEQRSFWSAFENSLIVAGSVGVTSTAVGTAAALVLARIPRKAAGFAIMALCCPVMLPPLVVGIACLAFYVRVGFQLSLATVILSHLVITQPIVILIVYARMLGFDYATVDSARDLGASPLRAFVTITMPIIQPSVIGAALIAMAISLDDFIITFFTIGGGNTLPTLIWGMIRTTLNPTVNAIATILLSLMIGSTLIALRITRYHG